MKFKRLRDLREDHNYKQKEIADYLNITQATYSEYESGKINAPVEALIKLAAFYHVTLDYITELTE